MSARIPKPRIGRPAALHALRPSSTYWISAPLASQRYASHASKNHQKPLPEPALEPAAEPDRKPLLQRLNPFSKAKPLDMSNPTLAKYLQKREAEKKEGKQVERPEQRPGKLSNTSIFKPDYEIQGFRDELSPGEQARLKEQDREAREVLERQYSDRLSALKLDPDPVGRKHLERKLVIRSLRRRGRLTKDLKLARTERQLLWRSQMLPTSVKKLTKLMHQIQGKTIEEAMVQLRFSKKKVAIDVMKGLQIARDEAIAARGMGLGSAAPTVQPTMTTTGVVEAGAAAKNNSETKEAEKDAEKQKKKGPTAAEREQEELLLADGTRIHPKTGNSTTIELKDGKRKQIYDPTEIYIDQAWVGRGPQTPEAEFRARGRVNMMYHRTTSFSVILKEEKTRMRISEEIQKKRQNRKLWVPMPDRPVLEQRQYCLW